MSNTLPAETPLPTRRTLIALAAMSGMGPAAGFAYLLLLALRLERVRGGLAARDVVAGSAA